MNRTKTGGFARLSINQQADIIRSICPLVAFRQIENISKQLYALDYLFVEISTEEHSGGSQTISIRYIGNTGRLQPYLNEIKLPQLL